jgi:TRAP transporter TAXI family solute receptor
MYAGRGAIDSLRTIANFYPEALHLVVRRNLGVWRIPDLRGHRISLDREGSGSRVDALLILEAYGLGPDDLEIVEASPGEEIDMMRDGTLDAFFMIVGTPGQAVAELADESLITLLPIDGPEAKVLTTSYPFFSQDFIPSGTYFNVPATETLSVGAQWLVRADLPEQQIYEITRALWHENTHELLQNGHPKGRLIRTETALDGLGVPLHPGAARYYREAGLIAEGEAPENGLAYGTSEAGEATNAGEGPTASPAPESE